MNYAIAVFCCSFEVKNEAEGERGEKPQEAETKEIQMNARICARERMILGSISRDKDLAGVACKYGQHSRRLFHSPRPERFSVSIELAVTLFFPFCLEGQASESD